MITLDNNDTSLIEVANEKKLQKEMKKKLKKEKWKMSPSTRKLSWIYIILSVIFWVTVLAYFVIRFVKFSPYFQ